MPESIHTKMARGLRRRPLARPAHRPRPYEPWPEEGEGGMVERELPFVMGVLGDFSGDPTEPLEPLEKRKFVQIDRVNFNEVMARIKPRLKLSVENTLQGDGTVMDVELKFNSLDDFEPARVVQQVEPLRKLMETRDKLRDLSTKVDRSQGLENVLARVLEDFGNVQKLSEELGAGSPNSFDDETKR